MTSLVAAHSLSVRYDGVQALSDASIHIERGELVGLIGSNGAGKTTLMDVISGFLPAPGGDVFIDGCRTTGWSSHRVARLGVARLFQETRLARVLTVKDNLTFGLQSPARLAMAGNASGAKSAEAAVGSTIAHLLESVGLQGEADVRSGQLSYGQQKLLAIAMCLGVQPKVMLLDEPFSGIAPPMIDRIIGILSDLRRQGVATLVIEHNMNALQQCADRLVVMDAGRVIASGEPRRVLNDPAVLRSYIRSNLYD